MKLAPKKNTKNSVEITNPDKVLFGTSGLTVDMQCMFAAYMACCLHWFMHSDFAAVLLCCVAGYLMLCCVVLLCCVARY